MVKKIFLICFLLCFASCLFSQDLSVPVSINSDGASLKDVCEYLSQQTGIDIVAGKSEAEWTVTDRKTVIHAENVPLKDLMTAIKNVFNLTWETDENGTVYLTCTDEIASAQLKLREEYFRSAEEEFKQNQENAYNAIVNRDAKNQYTDYFYGSEYYKNLINFLNAFPNLKNVLLNKESVKYNYASLNENQKNVLQALVFSYIDFNKKLQPALNEELDFFVSNENITFYVNALRGNEDADIEKDSIFAKLVFQGDKGKFLRIEILNPLGTYTGILANAMSRLSKGESQESVKNRMEVEVLQFKGDIITKKCIPCENTGGDIFKNRINLSRLAPSEKNNIAYKDVWTVIHNETGLNIVADMYYRDIYKYETGDALLGTLIQSVADSYVLACCFSNNILEVKDRYAYLKEAGMVPNQWIDYWVVRAYQNGGYVIEDLVDMAKLSDTQIDSEIANNPDLNVSISKDMRFNTNEVVRKRSALRFLGSLDDGQMKKLLEIGLSAAELEDAQWNFLQDALLEADGFYYKEAKANQSVKLTRISGKTIQYDLEYTSGFVGDPLKISLMTNRYTIKTK